MLNPSIRLVVDVNIQSMWRKKRMSKSYILFLILFLFSHVAFSQSYSNDDPFQQLRNGSSRTNAAVANLQKLNLLAYPFEQQRMLLESQDLLVTAEKVVSFYELARDDKSVLQNIILNILPDFRGKNTYPFAVQNFYALAEEIKPLNIEMLMAASVICGHEGIINEANIETLLEYSTIFIGTEDRARKIPASLPSKYVEPVTEELRIKHWPAAYSIISNAEKSIPLLKRSILNPGLEEHLRLRAAAFLHIIAPNELEKIIQEIKSDLAIQIICIQTGNVSWEHAIPNVCERLEIKNKRIEKIMSRKTLID